MSPALFDFNGAAVRVINNESGIWFVASDVCRVLEIANSRDAITGLADDEKDGVGIADAIGREQTTAIISESGLYCLIFKSRKPQAVDFRKWVTSEVLPTIRKTGAYAVPGLIQTNRVPQSFADALRLAADAEDARAALAKQLEDAAPKVDVYDKIMSSDCLFNFRQVSAMLPGIRMGSNLLVRKLIEDRILYRDPKGHVLAYREQIEAGRFRAVESVYEVKATNENRVSAQIKVTQTGLEWLAKRFGVEVMEMEPA